VKTLLAALAMAAGLTAQPNYPTYTAVDLLNGASFQPGLAPNTIVTLFTAGGSLSWATVAVQESDLINGNQLPTALGGVQVFVATYAAPLYYVSPTQVNLLIPSNLRPGVMNLFLARDGASGPLIQITVNAAAPALFQTPDGVAVATHNADNSLITASAPATAGEVITLYATGLGWVYPAGFGWTYSAASGWTPVGAACTEDGTENGVLPVAAQWLCNMEQFSVWISGAPIDSGLILYAGLAPGYVGLYQVDVRMPASLPSNPEIRVALGTSVSATGILLPAM
jgi:uncharacterized protein (TIGR03437 family)